MDIKTDMTEGELRAYVILVKNRIKALNVMLHTLALNKIECSISVGGYTNIQPSYNYVALQYIKKVIKY